MQRILGIQLIDGDCSEKTDNTQLTKHSSTFTSGFVDNKFVESSLSASTGLSQSILPKVCNKSAAGMLIIEQSLMPDDP